MFRFHSFAPELNPRDPDVGKETDADAIDLDNVCNILHCISLCTPMQCVT